MGLRKFGIEEAKKAGLFAKSKEQRSTVLAVANMFSIPIVIKAQVAAKVSKLELAFKKKQVVIKNLKKKYNKVDDAATADILTKADTLQVGDDWAI